jgi:hypothetical protein
LQKVAEVTDDEMTKKNKRDEKLETTKFTPKLLQDHEDDTASIKEATRRTLRYFQELVVHPSLLSMSTEDGAHRIAIVCDDNQFLLKKGLVQQLLLYPSVQSTYIIGKESQKKTVMDCFRMMNYPWGLTSPLYQGVSTSNALLWTLLFILSSGCCLYVGCL